MSLDQIDWASWYGQTAHDVAHLEHAYSPARFLQTLAGAVPQRAGSRVLELGCAPGRWLAWVRARLGLESVGLELDATGARLAHRLYPQLAVVRGDAFRLPFHDAAFDAVYAIGLIEHFDDPHSILVEARRVLRPGGVSIWLVPNLAPGSWCRWHWRRAARFQFDAHRPYTLDELTAAVTRAGFQVVQREYSGLYVPRAQRILGRLPFRGWLRRFEGAQTASNLVVVAQVPSPRTASS